MAEIHCGHQALSLSLSLSLSVSHLAGLALLIGLVAPQPAPLVQGLDQLGGHLDVVAEHLLVLRDAVDVAHAPHQVTVHARRQLTVPQLEWWEKMNNKEIKKMI